jgi:hypothetical protein
VAAGRINFYFIPWPRKAKSTKDTFITRKLPPWPATIRSSRWFDAKYVYSFWCQVTAIRNADLSKNLATPRDPVC